jgi:lipoyl(octanoyl) transferase
MTGWAAYLDSPLPFSRAVRIQENLAAARAKDLVPDTVLFLEHQPVVTLGARGRTNFLRASPEQLADMGICFTRASRGGDVTYHGPGQLILYPILKLGEQEADAHGYMANLEEVAIRTAQAFGVRAFRREGMNGAWTDAGKIAAIGFRLKRWVTLHGMSFNVNLDLSGFRTIIPCGLEGEQVTSLKEILGDGCPSVEKVRDTMRTAFETVFGRKLETFTHGSMMPEDLARLLAS